MPVLRPKRSYQNGNPYQPWKRGAEPVRRISSINPSNLPQLALEKILSFMDTVEILRLSQCSKKCADNIRRTLGQLRSDATPLMDIDILQPTMSICIKLHRNGLFEANEFKWSITEGKKKSKKIKLGLKMEDEKFTTHCLRNADALLQKTINQVLYIFPRCKVRTLRIRLSRNHGFDLTKALSAVTEVQKLYMDGVSYSNELELMLKQIRVKADFFSANRFYRGGLIENHLDCDDHIFCQNASWVSRDIFLNLKAKSIILDKTGLSSKDIADFVRQWMNMENNVVRYLYLEHPLHTKPLDLTEFEGKKWDPERRAQMFRTCDGNLVDCEHGIDYERSDGLLSTILQMNPDCTRFVVWKNRFPSQLLASEGEPHGF